MKKTSKFNIDEDIDIVIEDVKYCTKCKTKNKKSAKFCLECGNNEFVDSLKSDVKYCAKCGQELKKSAKFCIECGCNEFVLSLDKTTTDNDEVDAKYEAMLSDVLKKIDKATSEISVLNKKNADTEKAIKIKENDWKNKISSLLKEEDSVLLKNQELNTELDGYKSKLALIKDEIKVLNTKVKESNKKTDAAKKKIQTKENEKKEYQDKLDNLKKQKIKAESELKAYEKLLEDKRKKEEAARIRAEQEAKRRQEQAILQAKALEAERQRLNSPEYKFPNIESKWKGFATSMVIKDLIEMCNAGYSKAFFLLGVAYEYGYSVTQSFDQAKYWYQKSAASGDPKGRLKSGNVGVKYYNSSDISLLIEMAHLQDVTAMWTLGRYYQNSSQIGAMSNATHWYDYAGTRDKKNSGEAFFLAGECCRKNYGSSANALSYYVRSGESGYKPAQKYLMDSYKNTNPILYIDKKDPDKYQYWYEKYKSRW